MKKLVLDAGHGFPTPGKRTPNGANGVVREWTMNDNVCNYIAEFLRDHDVEITRVDDTSGKTDVAVQTRTNRINTIKPDLFVSIHHNANTGNWGTWTYVVGFYHYKKPRDKDLAATFAAEVSKQTGIRNNGAWSDDRIYPGAGYHMIRETNAAIPSVLIEGGFMDSSNDYPIITSDKGQRAYAQAVANVCISFLGLQKKNSGGEPIMGKSALSPDKMAAFLLSKNPNPLLSAGCSVGLLASFYISEGETEGVRGDMAFAQAIQETGWLRFGGDVLPEQNNYCGYAATNATAKGKGAWFASPQMGVRCHIQHLKAYASKDPLKGALVQPTNGVPNRFGLVARGIAPTWTGLNGKWAVPGNGYGEEIEKIYGDMKAFSQTPFAPYVARVTKVPLEIRRGPGTNNAVAGTIAAAGAFTIVEESAGAGATKWGRLKSGAGWISLDGTTKT